MGCSREELRRIIQELRSLQAKQEVFTASLRSLSNSQEWAIRDLIRVGRSSDNDLILPEDEPGVSREHAQISRHAPTDDDSQPTYFLQDYSRFGTWVLIPETEEWQKIHQQEVFLASGTQLKFGSSKNPALEFSIDCLDQQLEIVQRFRNDLEKGKKVAKWLDERRSHLAKTIGQHALSARPLLKQTALPKKTEAFYFTIEQFLECLSHCLIWGESSILENPKIPKVFEDMVYVNAFNHLREILPKNLADDEVKQFSDDGVEQLNEYIDCLLENLPLCEKLQID